ncbi:hypothetical protein ABXV22_13105 [Vibrio rotiferianus]|uniref:Fimbrial protein n=1 Tax=Vibrio rotiferianus TaxID=190895 RepID=A0A7Y3Z6F4_9VIBR|nr:hypothetical protein [Vibrio rotiferianus]NOH47152.1 hypothetical protein [Vibrio rotiferianus]
MSKLQSFLLVGLILTSTFSSACPVQWNVKIHYNQVIFTEAQNMTALLPGTVYVESVPSCRPNAIGFVLRGKNQLELNKGLSSLQAELITHDKRPLSYISNQGFVLPLSNAKSTKFWIRVPNARISAPGLYTSQIQAKLLDATTDKKADKKNIPIKLNIQAFALIKVSDSSQKASIKGVYELDLGELKSHSSHNIPVEVISNSSTNVLIKSKNTNHLVNTSNQKSRIPYQLFANNKSIQGKGHTIQLSGSPDSISFSRLLLEFKLGNIQFASAGQYKDTVVIEVRAN